MFFKSQRSHLLLCVLSATLPSLLTACAKKPGGPTNAPPLQVEVRAVKQRDVTLYGDWVATLDGYVNAQIQPQVSGYMIKQDYREGSVVESDRFCSRLTPGHFRQHSIKWKVNSRRHKHNLPWPRST